MHLSLLKSNEKFDDLILTVWWKTSKFPPVKILRYMVVANIFNTVLKAVSTNLWSYGIPLRMVRGGIIINYNLQ